MYMYVYIYIYRETLLMGDLETCKLFEPRT